MMCPQFEETMLDGSQRKYKKKRNLDFLNLFVSRQFHLFFILSARNVKIVVVFTLFYFYYVLDIYIYLFFDL